MFIAAGIMDNNQLIIRWLLKIVASLLEISGFHTSHPIVLFTRADWAIVKLFIPKARGYVTVDTTGNKNLVNSPSTDSHTRAIGTIDLVCVISG